jgi:arabinogalactan endo-1,4-beta-galactosidase
VLENGGSGVIYWEPAWVSSTCSTQWGQGSHQEHAAFFDFDANLLEEGGIAWMEYPYAMLTNVPEPDGEGPMINVYMDSLERRITVNYRGLSSAQAKVMVMSNDGRTVFQQEFQPQTGTDSFQLSLPAIRLSAGIYRVSIFQKNNLVKTASILWR